MSWRGVFDTHHPREKETSIKSAFFFLVSGGGEDISIKDTLCQLFNREENWTTHDNDEHNVLPRTPPPRRVDDDDRRFHARCRLCRLADECVEVHLPRRRTSFIRAKKKTFSLQ